MNVEPSYTGPRAEQRVTQATPAPVLSLDDPRAADASRAGGKAAPLARLKQAGHPVPNGFVVVADAIVSDPELSTLATDIAVALDRLPGPVAVRSSGLAEDLAGASFAGQYETVLEVEGVTAVLAAIRRCVASAASERVRAYREERGIAAAPIAVLVQEMIRAETAGVAFTAHPVTGERDVVVVSAVAGLGEALVSGFVDGEEWEIRGSACTRRRAARAPVLDAARAARVAALACAVAGDVPTDVEWALDGERMWLLQARPMTALPDPVTWQTSLELPYVRDFRLGEWIGAPLTPLSESWLVTELEEICHERQRLLWGMPPPRPLHVVVNGWYFYGGLNYDITSPWFWLRSLPSIVRNLPFHFREMMSVSIKPLGSRQETIRWREQLLPRYRDAVAAAAARVDSAPVAELPALVGGVLEHAGVHFTSMVGVAGYAAVTEVDLKDFLVAHAPSEQWALHELVAGADAEPAVHDVEGLDWIFPTLGERGALPAGPSADTRARVLAGQAAAQARVREALPSRRRKAFDAMVAEARAAHAVRLEQTGLFTLGWPVMRRALARLGAHLAERQLISSAEDVCFVHKEELMAALAGSEATLPTTARRATWERQRRLAPPLFVGERTGIYEMVVEHLAKFKNHEEHRAADAVSGLPGSPGRVTAVARVVRSIDELSRLEPGEVLVAPVTTPAWTLAFSRAAAVVTDTGSIASHASIVAREHPRAPSRFTSMPAQRRAAATGVRARAAPFDPNTESR
jgi:pyruvate,water dikinase